MNAFNGLGMSLGNLSRLSAAESRSICGENPTGDKGMGAMAKADPAGHARDLGKGWKCRAWSPAEPGVETTLADIEGPGAIQSMWFAAASTREIILRIYWDDQARASVEAPICDFFGAPWVKFGEGGTVGPLVLLNSIPVVVAPNRGMNCFWEMPFRKRCRITVENLNERKMKPCFHQINYTLTDIPEDCAYFHAQFRRQNPLPHMADYTIVDDIKGNGQYVGTVLGVGVNADGWWGEGEVKFFMDGDTEYPTICGTGTEDYFGGAYNWEVDGKYVEYSTPFMGMHQVLKPDGLYRSQHRHSMYRWHVMDPVICSVAFWYQTLPTAPFPELPCRDELEVV